MTGSIAPPAGASQAELGRWFLRKFLRSPGSVASFWPSSRHLAAAMLRDLELPEGGAVLEFGTGTGPFTDAIAARLSATHGYLGIDRDADFVALLRARHPQLEVVAEDVFELPRLLAERPQLRPAAVICGLPLVAMPKPAVDALLETVRDVLPTGGVFRTFSYLHTTVNPNQWSLRRRMRRIFPKFTVRGPVLRNLPPAWVFEGRC